MTYTSNQNIGIATGKTIYRIIKKKTAVQIEMERVSRPVRIKFRNNSPNISGRFVFDNGNDTAIFIQRLRSLIRVRHEDAAKQEEMISLFDVAMIEYL